MATRVHSFTDDALGTLDATGIAEAIGAGAMSAAEAAEAAIARVESVNPQLGATAFECFDRARAQTSGSLGSGPFAGVPSMVKDNTDIAGLPSCHGSAAIRPHPAKVDFPSGAQYLAQGFALLGKTTLCEYGLTASTEWVDRDPTRNPWNTDYSVGASSGGSAALVASGALPIAHANDGGGSIRIPAAAAGLVGLKPSRERHLDQPGVRRLPVNLVAEGALTRTVRDTARFMAGMEATAPSPDLPRIGNVTGPGERRLEIGVLRTSELTTVAPEVVATVDSVAGLLAAAGHRVSEIAPPAGVQFSRDFTLYWGLSAALLMLESTLSHGRHFDPRRLDPFTKGLAKHWAKNIHKTAPAVRRLREIPALYDAAFEDLDLILSPTLSHPTPKLGVMSPALGFEELFDRLEKYVSFTPFNNVGGGPAISLPHGATSNGIPGSVHFSAARGDEATLLQIAFELEEASPFPDITKASP